MTRKIDLRPRARCRGCRQWVRMVGGRVRHHTFKGFYCPGSGEHGINVQPEPVAGEVQK